MKITLFFFGKKNEITPREEELTKRISFRCPIDIVPLPQAGIKEAGKAKKKEAKLLFSKLTNQKYIIVFDEHGQEYDSPAFSQWLKKKLVDVGDIAFVIGGAHGLHENILKKSQTHIRFGRMVWTRNLFRTMALEQIYRALEIDGGGNFHKN